MPKNYKPELDYCYGKNTLKNCHIAMKWRYLLKITTIGSGSTAVRGEKISPVSKRQFLRV